MDAGPDENPALKAESDGGGRARVKASISSTLKKNGAILPDYIVDALTDAALNEMADVRKRLSYMLFCFANHFENAYTKERLERLEFVFLTHLRDADNVAYLPSDIED